MTFLEVGYRIQFEMIFVPKHHTRKVYPNRLLATVSRMVSIANDERTTKASSSKAPKKKPKALLVAAWIHLVALIVAVPLGLIDVIPGTGPVGIFRGQPKPDLI